MLSPKDEEEFSAFETKVDEVMKILSLMSSNEKKNQQVGNVLADKFLGTDKKHLDNIDIDNFIVKVKEDRTVINANFDDPSEDKPMTQNKFAFMAEVEKDAARRAADRKERESIAQNLRKLGNIAFRKEEYEKAISMYSKAIDQIKDSPILYNNRALCYIRIGLYKRAIIDCDFVINKLDEKNLRSWLYRAKSYYLLNEKRNYDKSIAEAKKNNPKDLGYIEKVVADIETGADKIAKAGN